MTGLLALLEQTNNGAVTDIMLSYIIGTDRFTKN